MFLRELYTHSFLAAGISPFWTEMEVFESVSRVFRILAAVFARFVFAKLDALYVTFLRFMIGRSPGVAPIALGARHFTGEYSVFEEDVVLKTRGD